MESEKYIPKKRLSGKVQVKICGLTRVDEALACARMGVDAIGCVFFPPSPRHVTDRCARNICGALPSEVTTVGVFVDAGYDFIMRKADLCGLRAVQLHGRESPDLVRRLGDQHLRVVKALFWSKAPFFADAANYEPTAFLLECGQGRLPGGNARVWNWQAAKGFGGQRPFILAGGLTPDNVNPAIASCHPDAVDVSSGVESAPGRKDLRRVRAFMDAVSGHLNSKQINISDRRVF